MDEVLEQLRSIIAVPWGGWVVGHSHRTPRAKIPFVLGHALYMKAIHGGKAKNDKIDAHKIAALLRGGFIPQAYVYPPEMRASSWSDGVAQWHQRSRASQ